MAMTLFRVWYMLWSALDRVKCRGHIDKSHWGGDYIVELQWLQPLEEETHGGLGKGEIG